MIWKINKFPVVQSSAFEISISFSYASCLFLVADQKNGLLSINPLKSLISTDGMQYFWK